MRSGALLSISGRPDQPYGVGGVVAPGIRLTESGGEHVVLETPTGTMRMDLKPGPPNASVPVRTVYPEDRAAIAKPHEAGQIARRQSLGERLAPPPRLD